MRILIHLPFSLIAFFFAVSSCWGAAKFSRSAELAEAVGTGRYCGAIETDELGGEGAE